MKMSRGRRIRIERKSSTALTSPVHAATSRSPRNSNENCEDEDDDEEEETRAAPFFDGNDEEETEFRSCHGSTFYVIV